MKKLTALLLVVMLALALPATAFASAPKYVRVGKIAVESGTSTIPGVTYSVDASGDFSTLSFQDATVTDCGTGTTLAGVWITATESGANLHYDFSGTNRIQPTEGFAGVASADTTVTFTGLGSLEIYAPYGALFSQSAAAFTVEPKEGTVVYVYTGSSAEDATLLTTVSAGSSYLLSDASGSSDGSAFSTFKYLKLVASSQTIDSNLGAGEYAKAVKGNYEVDSSGTVYSVDITWGSMAFTYTGASTGTWNAAAHAYDGTIEAGWSCEEGADKITVTNRSNAAVDAALTFAPADGYSVTGSFKNAGDTEITKLSLPTADTYGTVAAGPRTDAAYFNITDGTISSGENVQLGTITVTVADTAGATQ